MASSNAATSTNRVRLFAALRAKITSLAQSRAKSGLMLNEHIDEPATSCFVTPASSPYRSGRSRHWIKSKNPRHPAVKRGGRRGLGANDPHLIRSPREHCGENRPPKGMGGQGSEVSIKAGAVMSGDSMTANHLQHKIATFPRSPGRGRIGLSCRPAIAYSRVDTGRTPSAVPSSSNFPASHLGSQLGLIAQSYRAFSFSTTRPTYTIAGQALF
jgi:hypothetical protein